MAPSKLSGLFDLENIELFCSIRVFMDKLRSVDDDEAKQVHTRSNAAPTTRTTTNNNNQQQQQQQPTTKPVLNTSSSSFLP
jgi:hypothetical protein